MIWMLTYESNCRWILLFLIHWVFLTYGMFSFWWWIWPKYFLTGQGLWVHIAPNPCFTNGESSCVVQRQLWFNNLCFYWGEVILSFVIAIEAQLEPCWHWSSLAGVASQLPKSSFRPWTWKDNSFSLPILVPYFMDFLPS